MAPLAETYRIDGGALVRSVIPRRGNPYEHACTEAVFKDVAYAIEQSGSAHFRAEDVRAKLDAPFTQANVAVMFLAERGCIERTRGRRYRAAGGYAYEDALIEYHALKDGASTPAKDEQP